MAPKFYSKERKWMVIAQQAIFLRNAFPDSEIKLRNNKLIWIGNIKPTNLSKNYKVKIEYKLKNRPDVTILAPPLRSYYNNRPLPHVFKGQKLCLFMYKYAEWSSGMRIDETIVPWTSLWLFYYEVWLLTGEWHGGGEHPEKGKAKSKKG
jgi:hypothetical protein